MPSKTSPIYQLKTTLKLILLPIWRRIQVSGNTWEHNLRPVARRPLLSLPLQRPLPFDLFADQLIAAAGLVCPAGDEENQRSILHGLIESIVKRF